MGEKDTHLSSVKLPIPLWDDFRVKGIKNKITFQKLVERSMHLYVTNSEFRKQINNHIETFYTGSGE